MFLFGSWSPVYGLIPLPSSISLKCQSRIIPCIPQQLFRISQTSFTSSQPEGPEQTPPSLHHQKRHTRAHTVSSPRFSCYSTIAFACVVCWREGEIVVEPRLSLPIPGPLFTVFVTFAASFVVTCIALLHTVYNKYLQEGGQIEQWLQYKQGIKHHNGIVSYSQRLCRQVST